MIRRQRGRGSHSAKPLAGIVHVSGLQHSSSNIEYDSLDVVRRYIPSANAIYAMERFTARLESGGGAISIVGPYGSGKSTFGIVLSCLAGPGGDRAFRMALSRMAEASDDAARRLGRSRKSARVYQKGMIRCVASARLEPIGRTLLRALVNGAESYFGAGYGRGDFARAGLLRRLADPATSAAVPDSADVISVITSLASVAPVMLMIDEFGKNIEYFAQGWGDGDLFLLQELAEMSGRPHGISLHLVTMQHMAFGDYMAGTVDGRMKEWGKIQGRFDMVQFSNSLEHTRNVLHSALPKQDASKRKIIEWARRHSRSAKNDAGVNIDADVVASCYPLHPLAVEALPELCSRYGQNERTLLSFVSGGGPGTVSRFIDESTWAENGLLPTMGADMLYDYFISGTGRTGNTTSRLVEVDTIIRDIQGLEDSTLRMLKIIGVLNLVGRSGRLRASTGMLRSLAGPKAQQDIEYLESKSVITYRRHADEYRIWHGTDIDISAKLGLWRKAQLGKPFHELMGSVMIPDPVIATRHGMETGTVRMFRALFDISDYISSDGYDGVVLYGTTDTAVPASDLAVAILRCRDVSRLRGAATEVAALRNVLLDDEVAGDRIALLETTERLAAAESELAEEFGRSYGQNAKWECHYPDGTKRTVSGVASSTAVSEMCNMVYREAPVIQNEMINRSSLTGQGATARNRLLGAIIQKADMPAPWFDDWSAERAIYEAIIRENDMQDNRECRLRRTGGKLSAIWRTTSDMLRQHSGGQLALTEIYRIWKAPPYGIKEGVMPILALLFMVAKRDNVGVYEHGTYTPKLSEGLAERLAKNPGHFKLKWFRKSRIKQKMIECASKKFGLRNTPTMLNVVGHMVGVVRMLPRYTRQTKTLTTKTLRVRDVLLSAREPDTLLFDDIPQALDMGRSNRGMASNRARAFAEGLHDSIDELQHAYSSVMDSKRDELLRATSMSARASLSSAAENLLPYVSDQPMKVFLGAISADISDDLTWMEYVGLSLTDIPPADWNDGDAVMFSNNLTKMSAGFKNMEALHFSKVAGMLAEPSVMVTVTYPDGREERFVLPVKSKMVQRLLDRDEQQAL